ncbi:MAG: DUF4093 domain-containing protein [Oscillospiraceae bacterium]|nr:DUF4093 domain-containing protein [Oscillospiraceae bacterium]
MLTTDKAVIVEGKYDKIRLSNVIDAVIICTDGFHIFKDEDKRALIRHYAGHTGIIILTDSDAAGFKIRNHIKGFVQDASKVINVYIPDIYGKERRKAKPSKEGKLGVEGIDEKTLEQAFVRAGITGGEPRPHDIDKPLLFELGLTGRPDSSRRRAELLQRLGLPSLMTVNALMDVLGTVMSADELRQMMTEEQIQ